MAKSMKAVVVDHPGPPEVLTTRDRPVPVAEPGWVLIRVKAFGLNRAELFTRQGDSPSVTFPRVLGIEAVGLIAGAPGGEFTDLPTAEVNLVDLSVDPLGAIVVLPFASCVPAHELSFPCLFHHMTALAPEQRPTRRKGQDGALGDACRSCRLTIYLTRRWFSILWWRDFSLIRLCYL